MYLSMLIEHVFIFTNSRARDTKPIVCWLDNNKSYSSIRIFFSIGHLNAAMRVFNSYVL
jgi:hypothetical protein